MKKGLNMYTKLALIFLALGAVPFLGILSCSGTFGSICSYNHNSFLTTLLCSKIFGSINNFVCDSTEILFLFTPLFLILSVSLSIVAGIELGEPREKASVKVEKNVNSGWKYILICSISFILLGILVILGLAYMSI